MIKLGFASKVFGSNPSFLCRICHCREAPCWGNIYRIQVCFVQVRSPWLAVSGKMSAVEAGRSAVTVARSPSLQGIAVSLPRLALLTPGSRWCQRSEPDQGQRLPNVYWTEEIWLCAYRATLLLFRPHAIHTQARKQKTWAHTHAYANMRTV